MTGAVLGRLLGPHLSRLAARLGVIGALTGSERAAVYDATEAALHDVAAELTERVLLIELNAARITGRLTADDPHDRWVQWQTEAGTPGFWTGLGEHYPTLLSRLRTVFDHRCGAAVRLARRFAADRAALHRFVGPHGTELVEVGFSAGDTHQNGESVAILTCTGGPVVYKPRSVAVDRALAAFLTNVLDGEPTELRIRVPDAIERTGYGWTAFVDHRFCADDVELARFYRNLGHWLAVLRLLGGTDMHAENLIAAGPVPVVVDCETLFAPLPPIPDLGFGAATDRAATLLAGSVMGTGLLPQRGHGLAWRGIDQSAIGSLPDEQPAAPLTVVLDPGTDQARIGPAAVRIPAERNLPSPQPVLDRFWDVVAEGFTDLTQRLRARDRVGRLEPLLADFAEVRVRVVPRSTESYGELRRMLWHPASLHDERAARRRAERVLTTDLAGAPAPVEVVAAEVAELLGGNIPVFTTTPRRGQLAGPRGTHWGVPDDLLTTALEHWRTADPEQESQIIRSAAVSAYLDDHGWRRSGQSRRLDGPRTHLNASTLDRQRRVAAADIVGRLVASAIHGDDGTATWVAPVLDPTGWSVLPLGPDMFSGLAGMAVMLAAYQHEVTRDRADPVAGADDLLSEVFQSLRMEHDRSQKVFADQSDEPAGGYLGVGSQLWGWLLLARIGAVGRTEAVSRAAALRSRLMSTMDGYVNLDLAGAIVPLLRLAEYTDGGDDDAWALVEAIGDRLVETADLDDEGIASWPGAAGLSLSDGHLGIGWALSRLARATGERSFDVVADAAYAAAVDASARPGLSGSWIQGAAGLGIVAADELERLKPGDRSGISRWRSALGHSALRCQADGFGWCHSLAYGDLGAWEVLALADAAGVGLRDITGQQADAWILRDIEDRGPVSGLPGEPMVPGLLAGLAGIAYQLLRMHPECPLPSVLLPDPGPQ